MPKRIALPTTGNRRLDEHLNWWLSRFRPATQDTYRLYAARWITWCTGRALDPLAARRPDVETWLRELADRGLSRSSVAVHYDAVASIYRHAYDEELIDRNPCARIPRPKVHRELQHREVLTVLEYAAMLSVARRMGPNEHLIMMLAGMMGLRASEMADLTVESLSIVRGYTTITFIGKGDKAARIPVSIPVLTAIDAAVDGRTSGPLLRTRTGTAMDRRAVYRYVRRIARAAGITRRLGPHALRRTAGTVAIASGLPLREVQRLLRHARSDTTIASYDLTGDALERHASHQVAGFLAGFAD